MPGYGRGRQAGHRRAGSGHRLWPFAHSGLGKLHSLKCAYLGFNKPWPAIWHRQGARHRAEPCLRGTAPVDTFRP